MIGDYVCTYIHTLVSMKSKQLICVGDDMAAWSECLRTLPPCLLGNSGCKVLENQSCAHDHLYSLARWTGVLSRGDKPHVSTRLHVWWWVWEVSKQQIALNPTACGYLARKKEEVILRCLSGGSRLWRHALTFILYPRIKGIIRYKHGLKEYFTQKWKCHNLLTVYGSH